MPNCKTQITTKCRSKAGIRISGKGLQGVEAGSEAEVFHPQQPLEALLVPPAPVQGRVAIFIQWAMELRSTNGPIIGVWPLRAKLGSSGNYFLLL